MSTLSVEDTPSPLVADSCAGSVPLFVSVTSTCEGPSTAVSLVGLNAQVAAVLWAQNCLRVAAWAWAWSPVMVCTVPVPSFTSRVVPVASPLTAPESTWNSEAVLPSPPTAIR